MKLVLVCLFAFVLCTVLVVGVTATDNVTSTDSTTDNPTTETNATDASDGADTTTTTSSSSETTTAQALPCFSCGNYNTDTKAECNSTEATTNCSVAECWIYRNEKNGTVTYARGCRSTDSKAEAFKCSDYTSEVCQSVGSATLCSKCCTGVQCNSGELTGSNSSEATTASPSAVTCFSCGSYSTDTKADCKSTEKKEGCPEKECWIYRNDKDGTVTYARGCKSTDSNVKDFTCSEYSSEVCKTVDSATLCSKCCTADNCNKGELTGSASTSFSGLFLAVAAATVVVSLTK